MSQVETVSEDAKDAKGRYKRCTCVSALPGRACLKCGSSHWLRACADCNGSGALFANRRYSMHGKAPSGQKCGFCNGEGWLPCTREEAKLAEEEVA